MKSKGPVPRKRVSVHTNSGEVALNGLKSEFRIFRGFSVSGAPWCLAQRPHCGKAVNTSNSCLPAQSEILSLFGFSLLLEPRKQNSGEIYLFGGVSDRKIRLVFSPSACPHLQERALLFFLVLRENTSPAHSLTRRHQGPDMVASAP